jgi:hypothetical protein
MFKETLSRRITMPPMDSAPSVLNACGLTSDLIRRIARQTGFCKRASGKIDVIDFLNHFCEESVKGTVSYNDLAAKMQAATSVSASRQRRNGTGLKRAV